MRKKIGPFRVDPNLASSGGRLVHVTEKILRVVSKRETKPSAKSEPANKLSCNQEK